AADASRREGPISDGPAPALDFRPEPGHPPAGWAPGGATQAAADPLTATALFRAAEVAHARLQQPVRAAALLERLLREQPQSQWQALAERLLRQLNSEAAKGNDGADA